jgi:hypothetical protein
MHRSENRLLQLTKQEARSKNDCEIDRSPKLVCLGDFVRRKRVSEKGVKSNRPCWTSSISLRIRFAPPGQSVVTILWSPSPAANGSRSARSASSNVFCVPSDSIFRPS